MQKQKSDGAYFIWSASILLCLLLAFFTIIFASCAGGKGETSPSPATSAAVSKTPSTNTPESQSPANSQDPENSGPGTPAAPSVELGETSDMGQEYVDKFYFLGDSTTNGLAHYEIVDKKRVWTPENGTLTLNRWNIDKIQDRASGTNMMITDAVRASKPEYLLITLGVNGVSFMTQEQFSTSYKELIAGIQEASPGTKIILNSVYPVAAQYVIDHPNYGINNAKIDVANGWIRTIAEDTGVRFLNSSSILKDGNGDMTVGYDNGDYIHPNADTYKLIINYIRTHGYA